MQEPKYIKIKDKNLPIVIRSFKNSKYLKLYFKADILYVSKPKYVSLKTTMDFIKKNENYIYQKYAIIENNNDFRIKKWKNGETFFYKGEKYTVEANSCEKKIISINFEEDKKILKLSYYNILKSEERKLYIDKVIKKILKENTESLLNKKLPYWSKITNITYKQFKVNDATSKFGSCIPKTRSMHFSSRLIMFPEDKIDAIIVHELCHIVYSNHSKDFYNLVRKYIPNYDEINKWLKKNGKMIVF